MLLTEAVTIAMSNRDAHCATGASKRTEGRPGRFGMNWVGLARLQ